MRLALITLSVAILAATSLGAQTPGEGGLQTRVWLDRGDEPVLRRGETVRIYYRTTEDAYAAIFRIDTDGRISMIFPQDPSMDARVRGGQDFRLMLPNSPVWRVDEDPGVGYFFMVSASEPLDFSAFPFDPDFGWDLAAVGDVVYEDPYLAIDEYVAQLIPSWEVVPYALDFITYNVGDTYTYPRFLCYDCHDARPYASWNPYSVPCTTYRVVIWDDPYFYPYYRYSGARVVVARPVVTQPRYAVTARSAGDSFRPLIRSRAAPPRTTVGFKEDAATARPTATPRRASRQPSPAASRPTLQRRPDTPSSRLPVRTPPSSRGAGSPPAPNSRDARIERPTRPSTPSARSAPRVPSRPSQGATPLPATRGSNNARPSAPTRPSVRPSAPSRPTGRPVAPSRPTTRPAAPSRPPARPAAPSRPAARPAAPSRPPARPTVRPRPNNPPRRPGG